eukprot:31391-Pelagococcus_subviridis.AAC.6
MMCNAYCAPVFRFFILNYVYVTNDDCLRRARVCPLSFSGQSKRNPSHSTSPSSPRPNSSALAGVSSSSSPPSSSFALFADELPGAYRSYRPPVVPGSIPILHGFTSTAADTRAAVTVTSSTTHGPRSRLSPTTSAVCPSQPSRALCGSLPTMGASEKSTPPLFPRHFSEFSPSKTRASSTSLARPSVARWLSVAAGEPPFFTHASH